MASSALRRLALGASLVTGTGLVAGAAYGVASLDGPMADAAQRQQRQVQEQVVRTQQSRERPCPHRSRTPSTESTRSVTL